MDAFLFHIILSMEQFKSQIIHYIYKLLKK